MVSESGIWLDSDGNLLNSEPEEGRLVVAPGTAVSDLAVALFRQHSVKETAALGNAKETADQPLAGKRK
jgi:hypothetical protein